MKSNLFLVSVLLAFISIYQVNAQAYHFQEGFGETPTGWDLDNTFLTGSSSNVHNEFPGEKAVKMKGVESTVQTASYMGAGVLSYWLLPTDETATIKVEKSTDEGSTWTELELYSAPPSMLDNYQFRTITVDDDSPSVIIKFTAAGGEDGDGIFYLDDVSLTMMGSGEDVALLNSITVNGFPVMDFNSSVFQYSMSLFYGEATDIVATPSHEEAQVDIAEPSDLHGDATARTAVITVTSLDGTNTEEYSITFTVSEYLFYTGFFKSGGLDIEDIGWETSFTSISENIPGPGNHGEFDGPAAFKFIRGQSDKEGYLQSPKYKDVKSVSFWLLIEESDPSATLKVESIKGEEVTELGVITASEMSADNWTLFSYEVAQEDSTYIMLTPTLPTDGDCRLWIDDLSVLPTVETTSTQQEFDLINVAFYPNPVQDKLFVSSKDDFQVVTIYNELGSIVERIEIFGNHAEIDMSDKAAGMYFLQVEGRNSRSTQKIIKK